MNASTLLAAIEAMGIRFFTGVPDSQLRPFCDALMARKGICQDHQIAPNEGVCTALAAGEYLSSGRPACVYLQNSGLGNIANPVCSLTHPKVYAIPTLFVVGWRESKTSRSISTRGRSPWNFFNCWGSKPLF